MFFAARSFIAMLAAFVAGASADAVAAAPHIAARPSSVMVNGTTNLIGSGFSKHTKIMLSECSSAVWIAPQEPCDATNKVTVKTNASGGFKTALRVQLCPVTVEPSAFGPRTPPTEETCYIGAAHPRGIDQIELVGAVSITVSWP